MAAAHGAVGLALLLLVPLAACGPTEPDQARFAVRGRWQGPREITVRIEPEDGALPAKAFRSSVRLALEAWQATGCARFREAKPAEPSDLVFTWAREEHAGCVPFGSDPSVAHAGPVGPGTFVHFDAGRTWDRAALRRAAMHEIGHVLGLDHTADEDALMHPEPSARRARLAESDLAGIHSLYGGGERGPADLVVERSDGEPVLTLYSVAPRGVTAWSMVDLDGDRDEEIVVWRTDREGHGAVWEYHFAAGPVLERAVGPRYGVGRKWEEGEVLRGDLDGDGVVEVAGRRVRGVGGR